MTNKNNNKKKSTSGVNKKSTKSTTVSVKQIKDEPNFTIFKVVVGILIIAIIIFICFKACKKTDEDKKENKKEDIKEEIKKEEEQIINNDTSSYVAPIVYEENENQTYENAVYNNETSKDNEEIEEDISAPIILNIENNGVYNSFIIQASDNKSSMENMKYTIDGKEYNPNDIFDENGEHILVVTDENGNETSINFMIAKFVKSEEDFNEAMNDESNKVISFEESFNTQDGMLPITRSVHLTSKEGVELPFALIIPTEKETEEGYVDNPIDLKLTNINITKDSSKLEEEADFDFGIGVENLSDVSITLENTKINLGTNKSFGIVIAGSRNNTKIDMKDSKIIIDVPEEEKTEEDISAGIYVYDESGEDETNNIDINIGNSTIEADYPLLFNEKALDDLEINIDEESNITEDDAYYIPNEEEEALKIDNAVESEVETGEDM